jgi:hypothetical protein
MLRYLSLLGLIFLGVGAIALSSAANEPVRRLPQRPTDGSTRGRRGLLSVPSFHARFSLN